MLCAGSQLLDLHSVSSYLQKSISVFSTLKGRDLAGVLPPSIAKLPYLTQINFARNFLSGNIPSEWASTKLEFMALSVNNLSGPIPAFLGNITTLTYLSLESNMFSGTVPPELGNLVNLQRLIINANNLTGVLPLHLTNLTKLTELRISSNNFIGRIPNFFRSWGQLEKLEIQASGLQGPIPSSISVLSKLKELRRISDLNGGGSVFPDLTNMKSMERLMLRSCNLYGPIPDLTAMKVVIIIDLSFNQLEGSFQDLEDLALDTDKGSFQDIRRNTSNILDEPKVKQEVDDCEVVPPPTEMGGTCELAVDTISNIVAFGTVFDEEDVSRVIHGVPMKEGCVRVSVDGAIQEEARLPFPVGDEMELVGQAVGSHVAWPEELVIRRVNKCS